MSGNEAARARLYADDITPGSSVKLGSWTVTREEILAFGRQWDPLLSHTDEEWAAQSVSGGLIASGVHTMAITQRLTVDAVWSQFVSTLGRSIGDLRMRHPVRPGDTLTGVHHFDEVRSRGGTRALTVYRTQLHNQDGILVFEIAGETVIPLRPNPGGSAS